MNNTERKGGPATATLQEPAITEKEKQLVDLTTGKKIPETDKEKKLADQISEIKNKGRMVYIPHD